jgi:hypothetical protein
MMGAALATALPRCIFKTIKWSVVLQHVVENCKHLVGYRDDGTFLSTSR